MVKQIYLAGSMTNAKSFEEANAWREYIKAFIKERSPSVSVINPNDLYNFSETSYEYDSEKEIMDYDLWRLRNSQLVIVNFNADYSIGTSKEIAIARESCIPVIGLNTEHRKLHPWDECDCNKIFDNINKLLEYVWIFYLAE